MKDSRLPLRLGAEILGAALGGLLGLLPGWYELVIIGSIVGFFAGYSAVGIKKEPTASPPPQSLTVQALGAVPWGLFFPVMPILEVLVFLSPAWGTLLILRERSRTRRNGFLRGALVRLAVVVSIVVAAAWAPVKCLDEEVGPLPSTATLQNLARQYELFHALVHVESGLNPTLTFPRTRMTRREMLQSIKEQTGLKWKIFVCGNGVTILWGMHPVSLILEPGPP